MVYSRYDTHFDINNPLLLKKFNYQIYVWPKRYLCFAHIKY
jgi:hypothetical protein